MAHKVGTLSLDKMLRNIPLYGWGGSPTKLTPAFLDAARNRLKESGFSVELRGGRALISHPAENFEVEVVFDGNVRTIGQLADTIDQVTIIGEIPGEVRLAPYINALADKLISEPAASSDQVPNGRPQPGRPANKDFYRSLVSLANRLKLQGDSRPAVTIADWMSTGKGKEVLPEQVRVWLHRAPAYLREED